jgi:hypothetical protein
MCCKSTKLDVQALIDRLGPDNVRCTRISSGCSSARTARLPAVIGALCSSPAFLTTKAKIGSGIETGNRRSSEGRRDFSLSCAIANIPIVFRQSGGLLSALNCIAGKAHLRMRSHGVFETTRRRSASQRHLGILQLGGFQRRQSHNHQFRKYSRRQVGLSPSFVSSMQPAGQG